MEIFRQVLEVIMMVWYYMEREFIRSIGDGSGLHLR